MQVQERFEVDIKELPEQIDTSTYSKLVSVNPLSHFNCLYFLVEKNQGYHRSILKLKK